MSCLGCDLVLTLFCNVMELSDEDEDEQVKSGCDGADHDK